MAKTNVTPWDSQGTATRSVAITDPNIGSNYFVMEDTPGTTVVKNLTAPVGLEERVTMRYSDLSKVSTQMDLLNASGNQKGYQFVIKDEYVLRTTDGTTNAVEDDPVVCYLTFRTTKSANLVSGLDVAKAIQHLLGFVFNNDSAETEPVLDRIMRGGTKPIELV